MPNEIAAPPAHPDASSLRRWMREGSADHALDLRLSDREWRFTDFLERASAFA